MDYVVNGSFTAAKHRRCVVIDIYGRISGRVWWTKPIDGILPFFTGEPMMTFHLNEPVGISLTRRTTQHIFIKGETIDVPQRIAAQETAESSVVVPCAVKVESGF